MLLGRVLVFRWEIVLVAFEGFAEYVLVVRRLLLLPAVLHRALQL